MVKSLSTLILIGLLTAGCSVFSGAGLKAPCNARPTASLDADPCGVREPVNTAMTAPSASRGTQS